MRVIGTGETARCLGTCWDAEEGNDVHLGTLPSARTAHRNVEPHRTAYRAASPPRFLGVTPLELLWNGWRSEYVGGIERPTSGSLFAAILASGLSDEDAHIVRRGERVFAIMNRFPYTVGHVLVLPYRVVAGLDGLTSDETSELWSTVEQAVCVVTAALQCTGVNVGLNLGLGAGGSVPEHLHVHVVPRWVGDVNFMTATANTRTLPEALPVTAAKLRDAWASA